MIDVRLPEVTLTIDGKDYILRCNFNSIADVQEEYGSIPALMDERGSVRTALIWAAAMANDYADSMGWPERFTDRTLGRALGSIASKPELLSDILSIVAGALRAPANELDAPETDEKN